MKKFVNQFREYRMCHTERQVIFGDEQGCQEDVRARPKDLLTWSIRGGFGEGSGLPRGRLFVAMPSVDTK